MFNWLTQLRIKMIPTMEKWSDLGFVEIAHPDDFFSIGYHGTLEDLPDIKGVICPIPKDMIPDEKTLATYYNAVRGHPHFECDKNMFGDTTSRLIIYKGYNVKDERTLPPELVAIEHMLSEAFETTLDDVANSAIYQVDSNHHRKPKKHAPTAVATLAGPTTIMFAENANGRLIGKKSLPPNSMAIFLGTHAAPDTNAMRLNIFSS